MSMRAERRLAWDLSRDLLVFWVLCAFGLFVTIAILGQSSGSGAPLSLGVALLSAGATFLPAVLVAVYVQARPLWGES